MKHYHSSAKTANQLTQHEWGTLTWLANKDLNNTERLSMAYVVIEKGQQNPRHRHNTVEELLYLISGQLVHSLGDAHYTLDAGDTITIPAGIFHNAVNKGDEDAHMLVVYSSPERDFELESDVIRGS